MRHGDVICQGRAADGAETNGHDGMANDPRCGGNAARGVKLGAVALAVINAKRVTGKPNIAGDGKRSGRVEATGEEYDGFG